MRRYGVLALAMGGLAGWMGVGSAQETPPIVPPPIVAPAIVAPPAVLPAPVPSQPFTDANIVGAADVLAPQPAAPGAKGSSDTVPLKAVWKKGLYFEGGENKDFSIFVGGRVQFDTATYVATQTLRKNVPGTNPLENGVNFRRVRIDLGGTIYQHMEYYVQVDVVNALLLQTNTNRSADVPAITDLWMAFHEVPYVGNLKVGNQKPPIGFEHLTSSRFLNFMERSIGFDAMLEGFNNGFQPGITAYDTYMNKEGTWAIGLFKNTRNIFPWNVGSGELEVTGRVTHLAVDNDGGKELVHLGLGASARQPDENSQRFRSRLDVRNSPSALSPLLADTGFLSASEQYIVDPELAAVYGPFSMQAEYCASWLVDATSTVNNKTVNHGLLYYQAAYVEGHYFLTGEHREYDKDKGVFGRVNPRSPARWTRDGFCGYGAWQVAIRYSYLNLNSNGVHGGIVNDVTLGLNWFLNPNTKFQFNYSMADRNVPGTAGDGLIHQFGTRLAWDF